MTLENIFARQDYSRPRESEEIKRRLRNAGKGKEKKKRSDGLDVLSAFPVEKSRRKTTIFVASNQLRNITDAVANLLGFLILASFSSMKPSTGFQHFNLEIVDKIRNKRTINQYRAPTGLSVKIREKGNLSPI